MHGETIKIYQLSYLEVTVVMLFNLFFSVL